uniref:EGF-like domain-containing protein n=1 Tax=Clastoptera arizonana TaxID=38151 RepID=A0A1B6D591_9HEMI
MRYITQTATVLLDILYIVWASHEKLHQGGCDLTLSKDTAIWRPNQTHELNLPVTNSSGSHQWEATIDMQSGDILLVRINDTAFTMTPKKTTLPLDRTTARATTTQVRQEHTTPAPTTRPPASTTGPPSTQATIVTTESRMTHSTDFSVYQVSRPGRDRCDVTEGVLLDVTPLSIEGRKVVALYDKDLADGANLLIVTSKAWNSQCIVLKVNVKSDNCGDNEDCSGKGVCFSNASMEGYECQCCPGFIGPHCEEQDACFPSPCKNHGICVDISQGHDGSTFQCLCPYGFTGKVCEDTSDPCGSGPCQNGATCSPSNLTAQQFRCDCKPGFSGPLCQQNLDQCMSSPCQHGICVDQRDGYRCYCQPGFAGDQCQYEYNECESVPCMNGGTCTDHIGSFSCNCGRGYTGKTCNLKIDLCDPNPCSRHHVCKDKGNTYSCDCPKGYTGADCLLPRRAACSANPCRNGGTCWSSVDSFYCACRPGYTGKICNEEVRIEVIPSTATLEMSGNNPQPLDLQMPISIHLDHLHNIYVAAGTLACALLIVVLTVAACHCRIHETYKYCFQKASPLLVCNAKRFESDLKPTRLEVEKEHMQPLATGRAYPSLDNTEMYYALDFSDSQSSPLIQ